MPWSLATLTCEEWDKVLLKRRMQAIDPQYQPSISFIAWSDHPIRTYCPPS